MPPMLIDLVWGDVGPETSPSDLAAALAGIELSARSLAEGKR